MHFHTEPVVRRPPTGPILMPITPELAAAYWAADYLVFTDDGILKLRAGETSAALAALHRWYGVSSSAFVTAYNPQSIRREAAGNQAQQAQLEADVAPRWRYLRGVGVDPRDVWSGEESLLILGITREEAIALGCKYRQNAILFADEQGNIDLCACLREEQAVLDQGRRGVPAPSAPSERPSPSADSSIGAPHD